MYISKRFTSPVYFSFEYYCNHSSSHGINEASRKVLLDLCGKPMLMYQIERLQKSSLIDQIVVATSTNPLDDPIHKLCDDNNILVFVVRR